MQGTAAPTDIRLGGKGLGRLEARDLDDVGAGKGADAWRGLSSYHQVLWFKDLTWVFWNHCSQPVNCVELLRVRTYLRGSIRQAKLPGQRTVENSRGLLQ